VIKFDMLRALHENEHKLAACCRSCHRWAVLALERLITRGRGDFCIIERKPRCRDCGSTGPFLVRRFALHLPRQGFARAS